MNNLEKANEMALKAQQIFLEKFELKKQLQNLANFHISYKEKQKKLLIQNTLYVIYVTYGNINLDVINNFQNLTYPSKKMIILQDARKANHSIDFRSTDISLLDIIGVSDLSFTINDILNQISNINNEDLLFFTQDNLQLSNDILFNDIDQEKLKVNGFLLNTLSIREGEACVNVTFEQNILNKFDLISTIVFNVGFIKKHYSLLQSQIKCNLNKIVNLFFADHLLYSQNIIIYDLYQKRKEKTPKRYFELKMCLLNGNKYRAQDETVNMFSNINSSDQIWINIILAKIKHNIKAYGLIIGSIKIIRKIISKYQEI